METKEQKNESRTKEKKPLTEQQRQQRQKMLVYPLMVLLFAGCMWLIFAPSSEDKEKERQGQGFNTDMPMPEDSKIIGDKAKAYEQQDLENKRKERRGMVGDLSAFWNDSDGDTPTDDADTSDDYRLTRTETTDGETADERQAGIRTSAAAYQRLNTSLGTFYEPPKEDTEKEELRERIDELEAMLVAQDSKPSTMEEQVALLEKSYELAAKYQNDNNAGQAAQPDETGGSVSTGRKEHEGRTVSDVRRTVVSALPQPMTDSAFIADYSGGTQLRLPHRHRCGGNDGEEHHRRLCAGRPDADGRADGEAPAAGADARVGARHPPEHAPCGRGTVAGRKARHRHHLAGTRGKHHPGRTGGVRQRRAGGHLHTRLDGDRRGKGNRGEHGQLARKQHQHIDRRGGAARLRLGARGDTGHLAVHLEKDAHGQGTSEVRVQGIALPRKGMNSPKT